MKLHRFQSYQLASRFYRECKNLKLRGTIRDQLERASLSIALNLAEGIGRSTLKDREKFFTIAMGSIRECQALIDLADVNNSTAKLCDHLAASVYKLIRTHRNRYRNG